MDNARSYGSRFSGLGLFLLALLVVGVLVFLTIRSARDNDSQIVEETGTVQTEDPDFTITNTVTTQSNGSVALDTTTDTTSTDDGVVIEDSLVSSSEVAGESSVDSNLPNTGPESAIVPFVILMALSASFVSFKQSRQMLLSATKQTY